ncbi:serine hydrolase [Myxococcaceae bacterium GXIMD 01537]
MSDLCRVWMVAAGLMLWACGGSKVLAPEGEVASGTGVHAPDGGGSPWTAVDALLSARVSAAGSAVPGLGLVVYDAQDRKVYERMVGDFTPDRRVAVASASKMVSGAVLFEVIRQGHLSLDSTTGQVLGWTGDKAGITLRHLLSFTSGLPPNAGCTARPFISLAKCVETLADTSLVAAPGTRYDYGSTHLHVAARMAEVATGKSWNTLFTETLAAPLGLPPEVGYFTAPRLALGTSNPLVAGGLRASMNEYARLLALVYHRGRYAGLVRGTPELFDAQTREPFPKVVVGNSPVKSLGLPFRYGLAAWLECEMPASGCAVVSSPGAFGWTPWVDRQAGYYAILGMELKRQEGALGVVDFSVGLAEDLQPLIREALTH